MARKKQSARIAATAQKKQKKKKKFPFVRVDWIDISSDSGWGCLDEVLLDEPAKCISHGWLLFKNKDKVVIAGSSTSDGDFGDRTVFPTSVVKKINQTNLKEPPCQDTE